MQFNSTKKLAALLAAVIALTCSAAAFAAEAKQPQHFESQILSVMPEHAKINYIPDVVYSQVPTRGYQNTTLKMDILQPESGTEKLPAIVYVPGGGFINANRALGLQERLHFAGHGYVVASITYRVAPTAQFPAALEDVKSAIRYLRANADKFGIDKERIGIIGGSAGGYLSSFAAVTNDTREFDKGDNLDEDSSVKCAVNLYGIADLTSIGMDYSEDVQELHKSAGATEALWVNGSPVFGGKDGGIMADTEAAAKASPITYVDNNSAPLLLMHGTADTVVSPGQTDLLFQAYKRRGLEAERYLIPAAQHSGTFWVQQPVLDVITVFFDKYLKN